MTDVDVVTSPHIEKKQGPVKYASLALKFCSDAVNVTVDSYVGTNLNQTPRSPSRTLHWEFTNVSRPDAVEIACENPDVMMDASLQSPGELVGSIDDGVGWSVGGRIVGMGFGRGVGFPVGCDGWVGVLIGVPSGTGDQVGRDELSRALDWTSNRKLPV